jgi:hypothetical protein
MCSSRRSPGFDRDPSHLYAAMTEAMAATRRVEENPRGPRSTDEVFAQTWNESRSGRDAARLLGIKPRSAVARAGRLRARGIRLIEHGNIAGSTSGPEDRPASPFDSAAPAGDARDLASAALSTLASASDLEGRLGIGIFPRGPGGHSHFRRLERLGLLRFEEWGRDVRGETAGDVMIYRITQDGRDAIRATGSAE